MGIFTKYTRGVWDLGLNMCHIFIGWLEKMTLNSHSLIREWVCRKTEGRINFFAQGEYAKNNGFDSNTATSF